MRLASITLSGFKSFADSTPFAFDAPVTAVVGPNGCGKSNIVDAIKWVLGERSAKSLRGKEMADVIFAGSAARPAKGLASVTLTFENPLLAPDEAAALHDSADDAPHPEDADPESEDDAAESAARSDRSARTRRRLPIDTDMVQVERRLYRDGKSQYLINSKIARLKDIRDLFLDTGVGADAYSIIEQGKVDAMLLANPVERRIFFEEAAGIARFKARRTEAIRKLERTEINLTRTREQLESTERRLRIVKGQAQRARVFLDLDARRTAARLTLTFHEYHDLRERFENTRTRLNEIRGDHADSMRNVSELEDVKQQAELKRHELHRERVAIDRDRAHADHQADAATQRAAIATRNIEHATAQRDEADSRLSALTARENELADERDACDGRIAELQKAAGSAEERLEEITATRATHLAALAEHKQALTTQRDTVSDIDRQLASLAAQAEADTRRIEHFEQQTERRRADRDALDQQRAQTAERLDEARRIDAETGEALEANTASLETATSRLSALSQDQAARADSLNDLDQQAAALDARRRTLREMADAHEGRDDAARALLETAASSPETEHPLFSRIVGPLTECIATDREHAPAVEAALGQHLSAIVVTEVPPLDRAYDDLEGRVQFLPLNGPQPMPTVPPDNAISIT